MDVDLPVFFVIQAHDYDFVEADNFDGTVDVLVNDRAGNETTESFAVVNDTVAPTVAITAPERAALSFVVAWAGLGRTRMPRMDGFFSLVPAVSVGTQVERSGVPVDVRRLIISHFYLDVASSGNWPNLAQPLTKMYTYFVTRCPIRIT